ncbi:putative effector protein [Ceratobasidium theobromae]|uniref:Putative effector protein n=1 Tax=Ceratobasidium theobromae TaxID=1582974 RepID=A0A5N5QEH6_9AGAM|nr:putative effector protein [Ceratobasidium theobromae]
MQFEFLCKLVVVFVAVLVLKLDLVSSALAVPVNHDSVSDSTLIARASTYSGQASHYSPSAGMGACGWLNKDSDLVATISYAMFKSMMPDANPNHSKACGKTIRVTAKGKTVQAKVVDFCATCGNYDLDLSPAAYRKLAPLSSNRIGVSWKFT